MDLPTLRSRLRKDLHLPAHPEVSKGVNYR